MVKIEKEILENLLKEIQNEIEQVEKLMERYKEDMTIYTDISQIMKMRIEYEYMKGMLQAYHNVRMLIKEKLNTGDEYGK